MPPPWVAASAPLPPVPSLLAFRCGHQVVLREAPGAAWSGADSGHRRHACSTTSDSAARADVQSVAWSVLLGGGPARRRESTARVGDVSPQVCVAPHAPAARRSSHQQGRFLHPRVPRCQHPPRGHQAGAPVSRDKTCQHNSLHVVELKRSRALCGSDVSSRSRATAASVGCGGMRSWRRGCDTDASCA